MGLAVERETEKCVSVYSCSSADANDHIVSEADRAAGET